MKKTLQAAILEALRSMGVAAPEQIEIEVPKGEGFGDLSTPVAMSLSRSLRKPPRKIAEELASRLQVHDGFDRVEVAGPGFINITFKREFLHSQLRLLIAGGSGFLRADLGGGGKVQVEFVSANPTGPLHLGHGRGAAVGNALSNLLDAAGYAVEREYYINDAGRQVRLLGESVFSHYKVLTGKEHPFPEEGYRGDYVSDIAKAALDEVGKSYEDSSFGEAEEFFVDFSLKAMLGSIRKDLEDFGVRFDVWQSEKDLYESGAVAHAIMHLKEKGLLYESGGALWFRATSFGDEKDRVVIKSDGQPTYFASDIAYHLRKIERGFDEIINIWGADHHGYIPRIEAVMEALGCERGRLKVLLVQMVSLLRGGKPVQMSKRAGEFVTLKEVSDEVGTDTAKFIFLTRRHDSHLGFDIEAAKEASAENPVYYVQYANARINSIFAHAGQGRAPVSAPEDADLGLLVTDEEEALVKKLLLYPMTFELAALAREPHRITYYLQELSAVFHQYYNRHRVVTEDESLTRARLALCFAAGTVLRDGLEVLGVSAPTRM